MVSKFGHGVLNGICLAVLLITSIPAAQAQHYGELRHLPHRSPPTLRPAAERLHDATLAFQQAALHFGPSRTEIALAKSLVPKACELVDASECNIPWPRTECALRSLQSQLSLIERRLERYCVAELHPEFIATWRCVANAWRAVEASAARQVTNVHSSSRDAWRYNAPIDQIRGGEIGRSNAGAFGIDRHRHDSFPSIDAPWQNQVGSRPHTGPSTTRQPRTDGVPPWNAPRIGVQGPPIAPARPFPFDRMGRSTGPRDLPTALVNTLLERLSTQ